MSKCNEVNEGKFSNNHALKNQVKNLMWNIDQWEEYFHRHFPLQQRPAHHRVPVALLPLVHLHFAILHFAHLHFAILHFALLPLAHLHQFFIFFK
jgi:hypothetical protein